MKRVTIKYTLFILLCLAGMKTAVAQTTNYKAYSLYIYNFMKYIEWPDVNNKGDFVIGVLGDSPVLKELQELAAAKKFNGRKIVIKQFTKAEECTECHILYVSSSKSSLMKTLKTSLKGKSTLVVGEREGLAKKGASLSFVTMEDDTLKFDINKSEIEASQLKVSKLLFNLGIVVG